MKFIKYLSNFIIIDDLFLHFKEHLKKSLTLIVSKSAIYDTKKI
jgi:hypothetical protein